MRDKGESTEEKEQLYQDYLGVIREYRKNIPKEKAESISKAATNIEILSFIAAKEAIKRVQDGTMSRSEFDNLRYGLIEPQDTEDRRIEFLMEAMSKPKFAQFLSEIQPTNEDLTRLGYDASAERKPGTFLEIFYDAILAFLGISPKEFNGSMLQKVFWNAQPLTDLSTSKPKQSPEAWRESVRKAREEARSYLRIKKTEDEELFSVEGMTSGPADPKFVEVHYTPIPFTPGIYFDSNEKKPNPLGANGQKSLPRVKGVLSVKEYLTQQTLSLNEPFAKIIMELNRVSENIEILVMSNEEYKKFRPGTNGIYQRSVSFDRNKGGLFFKKDDGGVIIVPEKSLTSPTTMHEIIHGNTVKKIISRLDKFGVKLNKKGERYLEELQDGINRLPSNDPVRKLGSAYLHTIEVMQSRVQTVDETGNLKSQINTKGSKLIGPGNIYRYGMLNFYEFIAEAFTNEAFQRELQTIPPTENKNVFRSLWEELVNAFNKLLGINADDSVLSEVLVSGFELMSEKDTGVAVDQLRGWSPTMELSDEGDTGPKLTQKEIEHIVRFKDNPSRVGRLELDEAGNPTTLIKPETTNIDKDVLEGEEVFTYEEILTKAKESARPGSNQLYISDIIDAIAEYDKEGESPTTTSQEEGVVGGSLEALLEGLAEKNGRPFDAQEFLNNLELHRQNIGLGFGVKNGIEHDVIKVGDRIYKIFTRGLEVEQVLGTSAKKGGINQSIATPRGYLEDLLVHNYIFPEAEKKLSGLVIVGAEEGTPGLSDPKPETFMPVISEEFHEEAFVDNPEGLSARNLLIGDYDKIDEMMISKGFIKQGRSPRGPLYRKGNIGVWDLVQGNVVMVNGSPIVFDPMIMTMAGSTASYNFDVAGNARRLPHLDTLRNWVENAERATGSFARPPQEIQNALNEIKALEETGKTTPRLVTYHVIIEGNAKRWVRADEIEAYDSRDAEMTDEQMSFSFGEEQAEVEETQEEPEIVEKRAYTSRELTKLVAREIVWGNEDLQIDDQIITEISEETQIPKDRVRKEMNSIHWMFHHTPNQHREEFKRLARLGHKKFFGRGGKGMVDESFDSESLDFDNELSEIHDPEIEVSDGPETGNKINIARNQKNTGQIEAASMNEVMGALSSAMTELRKVFDNEKMTLDEALQELKLLGHKNSYSKLMGRLVKKFDDETIAEQTIESFKGNENMTLESRERALHKLEVTANKAARLLSENGDEMVRNSEEIERIESIKPDAGFIFNQAKIGDTMRTEVAKDVDNAKQAIVDQVEFEQDKILKVLREIKGENAVVDDEFINDLDRAKNISSDFIAELIKQVTASQTLDLSKAVDVHNAILSTGKILDGRAIALTASIIGKKGQEMGNFQELAMEADNGKKRTILKRLEGIFNASESELASIKKSIADPGYQATKLESEILGAFIARREKLFELSEKNSGLEKLNVGYSALLNAINPASEKQKIYLGYNPADYIVDGTEFPVMRKRDDGSYTTEKIVVRYNNTMKPKDLEPFKEALIRNKEYLVDNKDKAGLPEYQYIKKMTMQGEMMSIFRKSAEVTGNLKTYWLKSNQELFSMLGPLGREISRMQLKVHMASHEEMPAFIAGARRWNRAFLNAHKEMGFAEQEHRFLEEIMGPVQKWNEDNPSFGSLSEKEFYDKAYEYASERARHLGKDPSSNAKKAFKELLSQYEIMNGMVSRLGQKHGVLIQNERKMARNYLTGDLAPIMRKAITRGYSTNSRRLRAEFIDLMVNRMQPIGWGANEAMEGPRVENPETGMMEAGPEILSLPDLKKAMKQVLTLEEKNNALNAWISHYMTPEVLENFVLPYLKDTSSRNLFTAPNGQPLSKEHLMPTAYEVGLDNKLTSDTFIEYIDALYEALPHKAGRSDYAAFKLQIISNLHGRFRLLSNAVKNYGGRGDSKAYSLAHSLMDSRAQEAIIPIEFLQYETFDEVSTQRMVNQLLNHAYFGRGGERLMDMIQRLEQDLKGKKALLDDLASKVGGQISSTGAPKLKRGEKNRVIQLLESKTDLQGENGKERFKALEAGAKRVKEFMFAKSQLEAYMDSDSGPLKDMHTTHETLGTMAFLILQQAKSGLTNLLSLGDQMVVYKGFNKYSIKATANSISALLGEFFGGVLENFGVELGLTHKYASELMPFYHRTKEHEVGFSNFLLNLGSRASKNASRSDQFKMGGRKLPGLRQLRAALSYEPIAEGRKHAPVSWRTFFLHPFNYLANLTNHSMGVAAARMVHGMVKEVATHIENVNATRRRNGLPELSEDYQVTAEELGLEHGKTGSSIENYNYINAMMELRTLGTISNMARDYLARKANGDNRVLTKDQVLATSTVALHDIAMEGGWASRMSVMNTNHAVRAAMPLQGWSFAKVNQMTKAMSDMEKGSIQAAALIRTIATSLLWLVPIGMMFTFGMDEYDEEILGKDSALRPAPLTTAIPIFGPFIEGDPLSNAKAMFERLGRAGNIGGVAFDGIAQIASQIDPYTHQRGFSLDTRVLAMAQGLNLMDAMKNAIHSRSLDYQLVLRPLMYTMGGNGYLQNHQMITNLFGIDSSERRVSNMIGNRNKVRAALAELEIERKPVAGGSFRASPFSTQIRRMEREAYANDNLGFMDAYKSAIEEAIARGDEDPEKSVLMAFKRRNLRTGISKYKINDEEWSRVINVFEKDKSESLIHAMSMHEKYIRILEMSGKISLPSPLMSAPPATSKKRQSYEELIRQSLLL
jgi:hypothetical protein